MHQVLSQLFYSPFLVDKLSSYDQSDPVVHLVFSQWVENGELHDLDLEKEVSSCYWNLHSVFLEELDFPQAVTYTFLPVHENVALEPGTDVSIGKIGRRSDKACGVDTGVASDEDAIGIDEVDGAVGLNDPENFACRARDSV